MDKEAAVQSLTDTMAKFTSYIGKRLPKDVKAKLADLRTMETNPLAKSIYDSMASNQEAADKLVYCAQQRIPIVYTPCPMSGGTAPG